MANHKLTMQEKLDKRKYKKPNRVVWWIFYHIVIKPFLSPMHKVHVEIKDSIKKCKGAAFIIYNHQSRTDFIWQTQCAEGRPLNFMVGYNEFFRSHLKFIAKFIHFIPKKNFTLDMPSMRAVKKIINDGGVVCFAPEGMSSINGHNQPIVTGTGKMLKKYGVPVYCAKGKGAFLSNTKVCLDERKGKTTATMSLLFSPEDLKALTPDEIDAKINEAIWQDDYVYNKEAHIKYDGKGNICSHLHDLLYRCPKCGHEFEMIGEGNTIKCLNCGNGAEMDDYYDFHPFEGSIIPRDPARWHDEERKIVYHEIKDNQNFEFIEKVKVGYLPPYHSPKNKATSELCGEGVMKFNHEGIFFEGTKLGKPFSFKLDYETYNTLVITVDCTYFAFYINGEYFDFFPERPVVGKLLLIVEEMHRLHGAKWKNLPQLDWVYE